MCAIAIPTFLYIRSVKMASTVCVSRCRLLAKLEINRGLCLSPIFRDLSNSRESWCRRWRPTRRCFFTSVCAHGSKSTGKVEHEKSDEVTVTYRRGLPVITIPLPSRREKCRFTLRPVSQTVGDLLEQLKAEDRGVERAAAMAADERVRIAASDTVEALLEHDFRLIINDTEYYVKSPAQERLSAEEVTRLSDVRNLVNQLYEALNVREHQIRKEREIRAQLEKLSAELQPLEEKRMSLEMETTRRTSALTWIGLGLMGVQFGVLARLTWWEYSWDIMEPVTYFVTYGTAMAAYAYFVLTKQEYVLPDVKDRQHLLTLHKKAKKIGLDINQYNHLKDQVNKLEKDLHRLHDPLQIHLPTSYVEKLKEDKRSPLSKIKDMLEETGKKMKIT
ncbi:calcium uniporter protein, mitochondrial isoform X2 [Pectinophora gossypiella]|uniref:calcium uniporter protein, mitochondrial isoform X2 n=1 Tax=Pectinophora gossypiella TaxID=13191 RepID=UPI00214E28FD|nr:calcium uniporter protein, mitochondrial isoform X2 [Pectinophora gossypiella]